MQKLLIVLLIFTTFSCNKAVSTLTGNLVDTAYKNIFTIQSGWNIYTGGVYRYGPSIIQNADGSIDAWFAAPGGTFGDKELFYKDAGAQSAIALNDDAVAAQKFTAGQPFYAIAVACPNWSSTNSSLTLSLYQWRTDYTTSVAASPLATLVYNNYQDNQNLQIAKNEKFSAGTYL